MKATANARFTITGWDEKPVGDAQQLPKMTRTSVTKTFSGDIEGDGHVEYVMTYRPEGSAAFVGLERIVATIAGRAGSFALQRTGVFENGQAKESFAIVEGSGTGALAGLRGEGRSSVGHGMEHPFVLQYELD